MQCQKPYQKEVFVVKNKRIVVTQFGGPEFLHLVEEDLPEPAPDQVRVHVLAAGVAWADVSVRLGTYSIPNAKPGELSPGYDIVGRIEKIGDEVRGWAVGQRVAALTVSGGYTEYICLAASELVSVPGPVDAAEAVALILNYGTAYQMLHRVAEVKNGDWILVHGAGGGVGTALLQLGTLASLKMIGTASASKQDLVARLGAT